MCIYIIKYGEDVGANRNCAKLKIMEENQLGKFQKMKMASPWN